MRCYFRLPDEIEAISGRWYKMTLQFYAAKMPGADRSAIVLSAVRVKEPAEPIAIKTDESRVPSHKASSNELACTNTTSVRAIFRRVVSANLFQGVGVICYKHVDGCYVYSHKLSRAALVIDPLLDVNVGDWVHVGL